MTSLNELRVFISEELNAHAAAIELACSEVVEFVEDGDDLAFDQEATDRQVESSAASVVIVRLSRSVLADAMKSQPSPLKRMDAAVAALEDAVTNTMQQLGYSSFKMGWSLGFHTVRVPTSYSGENHDE